MVAHVLRCCISAVVLGFTVNEAKPVTEESRHEGRQHVGHYFRPDGYNKLIQTQNFNIGRRKISPNLQEEPLKSNHSPYVENNHISRFSIPESRQSLLRIHAKKNLRYGKKPVNGYEQNYASEYNSNSFQAQAPVLSDESDSDPSVLFQAPTEVPRSAPYPPAVRVDTGDSPLIQTNHPGSASPDLSLDRVLYSPSGDPYIPQSQEDTREYPVVQTNSAESLNPNSPTSKTPPPSSIQEENEEESFAQDNLPESSNLELRLTKNSNSPSEAPFVDEQTEDASFIQTNSLESSNPDQSSKGDSSSSLGSWNALSRKIPEGKTELHASPPGLDDDNRISLPLQDEAVPSPFLPNPDFFAFSSPTEAELLGKGSGHPFGFGVGFNQEGSSIGDATFIVPEGFGRDDADFELPKSEPPRETIGLTIDDGQTIRSELRKETGEFIMSFTSVDGTTRSESGTLVPTPNGERVMVLKGFYSYKSPEGYLVRVDYTSDQTGYHAKPTIVKPANDAKAGGKR